MITNQIRNKLQDIYETLLQHFGAQNWWPADTSFEVIVGAILAQQTSWRNVVKAIYSLKEADLVNPHGIISIDNTVLEDIIKPTQLNEIVRQMKTPSYDYKCDQENAWAFYNHVTHGLKTAHPRTWISDTSKFHKFITADLLSNMGIQKSDTTKDVEDEFSFLDEIDLDENTSIEIL